MFSLSLNISPANGNKSLYNNLIIYFFTLTL